MSRTINLMIRDDGVATIYDDTYDITIHCENEEEQHKVVELLKSIPSAQPERKTGKWELLPLSIIPPVYKCSACGRHAVWITTGCLLNRHEESYLSNFCPNCGADMRGEQDDSI